MIDGTYKIKVDVPFGRKDGTVVLRTKGDVAYADIDAPVVGVQSIEGKADGDTFTAEGQGKPKILGKIQYSLKGQVVGDDLRINISTNKGEITLKGVRAQHELSAKHHRKRICTYGRESRQVLCLLSRPHSVAKVTELLIQA